MGKLRNVSSNPHVRSSVTTQNIMVWVLIALLPATGYGI
ncbi:MAG: RnfABCDGE type electron transport complex subunit D, partial [Lachnospiraceae bacterium]|nr:RnfABCDGE type electron transport complex subunit D [Lachnospiraceae bacterium]